MLTRTKADTTPLSIHNVQFKDPILFKQLYSAVQTGQRVSNAALGRVGFSWLSPMWGLQFVSKNPWAVCINDRMHYMQLGVEKDIKRTFFQLISQVSTNGPALCNTIYGRNIVNTQTLDLKKQTALQTTEFVQAIPALFHLIQRRCMPSDSLERLKFFIQTVQTYIQVNWTASNADSIVSQMIQTFEVYMPTIRHKPNWLSLLLRPILLQKYPDTSTNVWEGLHKYSRDLWRAKKSASLIQRSLVEQRLTAFAHNQLQTPATDSSNPPRRRVSDSEWRIPANVTIQYHKGLKYGQVQELQVAHKKYHPHDVVKLNGKYLLLESLWRSSRTTYLIYYYSLSKSGSVYVPDSLKSQSVYTLEDLGNLGIQKVKTLALNQTFSFIE